MRSTPYVFYVKNMVCDRCILVVHERLTTLGLEPVAVELGVVSLPVEPDKKQIEKIRKELEKVGFEWIDDKRTRLTEQVKNAIIELVWKKNAELQIPLSAYLSDIIHYEYSYISNLFSEVENCPVEHYFILQKIERVKELLTYDEMTLGEIADLLHYSSTAHLSTQFKKVTALTPSQFKKVHPKDRKPLDGIQ